MREDELDILEFLITAEFKTFNYSSSQYIYFLEKYQKYYKKLNNTLHRENSLNISLSAENEKLKKELIKEKRKNSASAAIIENFKEKASKKMTFKERITGKLTDRFNINNI